MSVAARVIGDLRVGAVLVLAARHMAAERCRAAVLDRRHHFELAEADMAGIGLTPCRSMAAEDSHVRGGGFGRERNAFIEIDVFGGSGRVSRMASAAPSITDSGAAPPLGPTSTPDESRC